MVDRPPDWPADVQPMVLNDLKRLGTDKRNRLYWDGKLIRTPLTLTTPQTLLAFLAALASLASVFTGLNSASIYLCGRDIHWLGCPPAPIVASPPRN